MLLLENVDVFYDKAQVLHNINISIGRNEIVSMVGRNGTGKTTMLKAIIGLLPCKNGKRILKGKDVTRKKSYELSRAGISYVPETRDIFPDLTVYDNLRVAQINHKPGFWTIEKVFDLFPEIKRREKNNGDTLSGGEQQMLAIARGVLSNPDILLLDEPTEGLAPKLVNIVKNAIVKINDEGTAVFLVEQNLKIPLSIAGRQYIIENGVVVWQGNTAELLENKADVEKYISL